MGQFKMPPRSSWMLLWILISMFTGSLRFVIRDILKKNRRGKGSKNIIKNYIVIYGAGSAGAKLASSIKNDDNSKILDIGCAKGYMMHDLSLLIPGAEIKGVDVSNYAKENSIESMQDNIVVANANNLPFPDDYFDLVMAINTLHNLPLIDCKQAFREINRVTKNNSFVMNDAWRDAKGKQSMLNWNLTALTYMSCDDWEELFKEVDYKGDYYWFFAE